MTPGKRKKSGKASGVGHNGVNSRNSTLGGEDNVDSDPYRIMAEDYKHGHTVISGRRTRGTSAVFENMKQEFDFRVKWVLRHCKCLNGLIESGDNQDDVSKAYLKMQRTFGELQGFWRDLEPRLEQEELIAFSRSFKDIQDHVAETGYEVKDYLDEYNNQGKAKSTQPASRRNRFAVLEDSNSPERETALLVEQMKRDNEQKMKDLSAQNQRDLQRLIDRGRKSTPSSVLDNTENVMDRAPNNDGAHGIYHVNANLDQVLKELAVSNAMLARSCGLPGIKVGVFDGNILEYLAWETSFDVLIQSKTCNVHELLNYLESHLSGEPKEMIKGLLLLQSRDAYEKARKRLKNRYGNDNVVGNAFLKRLSSWPKINVKDGIGLRKFADFLDQIAAAEQKIPALGVLNYAIESNKIIGKLPQFLRGKWRDEVYKWRSKYGEASYPPLKEVAGFVDVCAEKMNIPELDDLDSPNDKGKIGTPEVVSNRDSYKGKLKVTSFLTECQDDTSVTRTKCYFCEEPHHIDDCEGFGKLSHMEKREFIMKRGLCSGCGSSQDHMAKDCTARITCRICKRRHLTSLHVEPDEVDSKCTQVCSKEGQKGEMDFIEHRNLEASLSVEDKRFMDILSNGVSRREDGHYEFPLPLKYAKVRVPNNRPLAPKRAEQVKRRLGKNQNLHEEYKDQMNLTIEKYAEKVPENILDLKNGRINYIPHSPVFHNKKGSLRIVNAMSAKYGGLCINDVLLSGPNLMDNMTGILLRFRKNEVAIMADIEKMFFQFYVNEKDRDMLRFLWWKDGDLSRELLEYRMKVFPFGSVSSPGAAMYGKKLAADDGEQEFGCKAAEFVRSNFYVDDGLTSVENVDEAVDLVKNSVGICGKAGLRLHKFVSNKMQVLESIDQSERAKGLQDIDLDTMSSLTERSLGILWNPSLDVFRFHRELVNDEGNAHCALISKSRAAPVKQVSIPRMERTAAVLSAKINSSLPVERLSKAEMIILKNLRSELFHEEMESLDYSSKSNGYVVKKGSPLYKPDPFLDGDGLMGVEEESAMYSFWNDLSINWSCFSLQKKLPRIPATRSH